MMEAATRLVAERALAVTLSGTPSNPPRALAFQMQKRLGLMSLPKVELVMPGMAVASMSNVEDYLAVTANPTLKLCKPGPASMPGGRAALSPTDTRPPTIGRAWRRLHNGERQRLGGSAGAWQGLEPLDLCVCACCTLSSLPELVCALGLPVANEAAPAGVFLSDHRPEAHGQRAGFFIKPQPSQRARRIQVLGPALTSRKCAVNRLYRDTPPRLHFGARRLDAPVLFVVVSRYAFFRQERSDDLSHHAVRVGNSVKNPPRIDASATKLSWCADSSIIAADEGRRNTPVRQEGEPVADGERLT